jgi:hypothetical protein
VFLGFYNFYRRFIKDYGQIARPLTQLTQKDRPFNFNNLYRKAFIDLQNALTTALVLKHYSPEHKAMLKTNASNSVVSGILSQKQRDNLWRLIAYFSKTINSAKYNYPIYDKELLAII